MSSWPVFKDKIESRDRWVVKEGEAYWSPDDNTIVVIRIKIPPTELDPTLSRIRMAQHDRCLFEFFVITDDSEDDAIWLFMKEWGEIWGDNNPHITYMEPPPEGLEEPNPIEWTPFLRKKFYEKKISKTNLAPWWGQDAEVFGDLIIILDSGLPQTDDPNIRYRQTWVAELHCPFCDLDDWNFAYIHEPTELQQEYYDKERKYYLIICPRCYRMSDVIDRSRIVL